MAEVLDHVLRYLETDYGGKHGEYDLLGTCSDDHGSSFLLATTKDGDIVGVGDEGVRQVTAPTTYKQMLRSPDRDKWLESMAVEVDSFKDKPVYRLVELKSVPKGVRIFRFTWKYRVKRHANGTVDKLKSRCCLMGNTMRKGVDFSESFSIGARMASIRLVFAICAAYGLHDKMIDVKAAYLNAVKPASGPGSETYVYQPPGFEEYGPNGEVLVGVLDQYVYGDPEAGRAWASMFHEFLVGLGARVTDFDLNLGRIDNSHGWLVYAKYVDELIVAGSTEAIVDWLRDKVVERFPGSTHGPWATVLGFGVAYDRKNRTVSVNAAKLILDACDKFGLEG